MTPEQLRSIMPRCPQALAGRCAPLLTAAMSEAGISTPQRQAAFLAQLAHESGELRYFEELATGEQYEGRKDLGNVQEGDGRRFKGRGPIQLTGRANYEKASLALGVDFLTHPEIAAEPAHGFRIAGWFWKSHGLNTLADGGPLAFDAITKRVNGGTNGKAQRDAYYATARKVLGC